MFKCRFSACSILLCPTKKILRPPSTGIPKDMAAELSGTCNLAWLSSLPKYSKLLESATELPQSDELWQSPTHNALDKISSIVSYFEILRYVGEHGFFFLIPKAIVSHDAPLPHIAYEDIMKTLLTCSMQRPPEEQFQLPATVLRLMLCRAAHFILHDPDYFVTIESWFRQLESQQSLGSEAWSAWVMCCVAGNRVERAILFLEHMQQHQIPFDPVVFNFMLHPSETIQTESGAPPAQSAHLSQHINKGFLMQQRLLNEMLVDKQNLAGTIAAGVHAMFVFYAITRQTVQQWETIRVAVQAQKNKQKQQQELQQQGGEEDGGEEIDRRCFVAPRTLKMIKSVLKKEKGQRCGPLTIRALVELFAKQEKDLHATCLVLSYLRQREVLEIEQQQQQKQKQQQLLEASAFGSSSSSSSTSSSMSFAFVPVKFSKQEQQEVLKCFSPSSTFPSLQQPHHQNQPPSRSISQEEREEQDLHLPLLRRLLNHDALQQKQQQKQQYPDESRTKMHIEDSAPRTTLPPLAFTSETLAIAEEEKKKKMFGIKEEGGDEEDSLFRLTEDKLMKKKERKKKNKMQKQRMLRQMRSDDGEEGKEGTTTPILAVSESEFQQRVSVQREESIQASHHHNANEAVLQHIQNQKKIDELDRQLNEKKMNAWMNPE